MNLKLNADGDLAIDKGTERVSGTAYVGQLISNRLKTLKGEWGLDRSIGLPWFTEMLRHGFNLDHIYSVLAKAIRETYGVRSLDFLQLNTEPATRKLHVTFKVTSEFGPIETSVEV